MKKFPILVFDMDGVLLDSLAIKQDAFAALFVDYPDKLPQIRAYNEARQGVPRAVKIRHVCTEILGLEAVDAQVQALLAAYRRSLEQPMRAAPLLPGVRDFLASNVYPKFVSSSSLAQDVIAVLQQHGILANFEGVYGYPESKAEVLARLKQERGMPLVFFGDALTDYEAAQAAGVSFIGFESQGQEQFRESVPRVGDFSDQRALEAILGKLAGDRT
jgi:phosphoglycolate phosphatase-like HAD superfamily hydrolase